MTSSNTRRVTVQYFAVLREEAGLLEETIESEAADARALYAQLCARHKFSLPVTAVKVAINEEFCPLETPLSPGDVVAFIPPVAGG